MRQYVSRQDLVELLNERLGTWVGCEEVRFSDSVLPYLEPDDDGCNWSPDMVLTGTHPRVCVSQAAQVVAWARERYNLLGGSGTVEDINFEHDGRRFRARVESRGTITAAPGQLADPQNASWWVEVNGASVGRAVDATLDDVDPEVIRREIVEWFASRPR